MANIFSSIQFALNAMKMDELFQIISDVITDSKLHNSAHTQASSNIIKLNKNLNVLH
jgi:hypothetical protein